jgi:hypothetical protein
VKTDVRWRKGENRFWNAEFGMRKSESGVGKKYDSINAVQPMNPC